MAYKRYNRRRYRRRAPNPMGYMGKAQKGLYLAGKALAVAQGVKSIINAEKKLKENSFATTQGTTPTVLACSGIAQGDDYNGREGRSVLAKSIQIHGFHTMNISAATTVIRYILFQDLDNSAGTIPTATQLMGSATPSTYELRNPDPIMRKRFKVLADKLYCQDQYGKGITSKIDIFHKLNHHIKFSGTAATSYGQGHVYLMFWSSDNTNQPTVNLNSRLRYYDN